MARPGDLVQESWLISVSCLQAESSGLFYAELSAEGAIPAPFGKHYCYPNVRRVRLGSASSLPFYTFRNVVDGIKKTQSTAKLLPWKDPKSTVAFRLRAITALTLYKIITESCGAPQEFVLVKAPYDLLCVSDHSSSSDNY